MLIIQPVHASKVGDAAFGGDACTAEKYDIVIGFDDPFQFTDLVFIILHNDLPGCGA